MLKQHFRTKALRQIKIHKREVKYLSLLDAHRIGIVLDVNESDVVRSYRLLRDFLKDNHIDYKLLVIELDKKSVKANELDADPNVTRVHRDEINWYGEPDYTVIDKFIKDKFDLLLDIPSSKINKKNAFTHTYIIKSSVASLKVGTAPGDMGLYDILIEKRGNKETYSVIENTLQYLSTIKTAPLNDNTHYEEEISK